MKTRQVRNALPRLRAGTRMAAIATAIAVVPVIAAVVLCTAGWQRPIETHGRVRLITVTGVSAALGRYAWLQI
jgi:hypothetical protein